jgi:hypothetical protein
VSTANQSAATPRPSMKRALLVKRIHVKRDLSRAESLGDRAAVSKARNRAIAARFREAQARLQAVEDRQAAAESRKRVLISDREIDRRAGLAEAHVSQALRSLEQGKTITLDTFIDIAAAVQADPGWLLTGEGGSQRLGDLPDWKEWERNARARYPTVPDFAIAQVGTFTMAHPPRLDAAFVAELARAWFEAAGDDLRAAVETEYVRVRLSKK